MATQLPDVSRELLDAASYVSVASVMPDGGPQTTLPWRRPTVVRS